jgi:hypothetical protein
MFNRLSICLAAALALVAAPSIPLRAQTAPADTDAIAKIRDEGLNRSQVMQTLSYLSDVIGPRLTGSPSMKRANEWARDTLSTWGLQNAHLEAWGPFGRGWTLKKFSAQIVSPQDIPLIAFPKAWSPGFRGSGEVVFLDATDEAGLAKYKGKLKGAIVLDAPPPVLKPHFDPRGVRYTDAQLAEMADAAPRTPGSRQGRGGPGGAFQNAMRFSAVKMQFLTNEGAALIVDPSRAGDAGTLFVQSATVPQAPDTPRDKRISAWSVNAPKFPPQIVVASEHYNRMVRMIQQGVKLRMDVDLAVEFDNHDPMAYNTVAEIPGTDLKDEVVMLGGHMDSWHGGTGATDNGAGDAVCMEAVRILQACHLQPRRTIRIALWSGEEEGLYGSRAYVAQHFGSRAPAPGAAPTQGFGGPTGPLTTKPEYEKISAYYNLDNGTGKIRGVYLQGNEAVRPIFKEWLAPFADLGATTLTIRNTGSTDHVSFDAIGIPGFQFIQDEIEYETLTHHSNMDVYDHLSGDDLKQASTIMAAFIYETAMRNEKLPRKAL